MTRTRTSTLAAAAFAIATCSFQISAQTTVTFISTRDATLYESPTGDLANGEGSAMFVGMTGQPTPRRALMWFDVATAVPAGAIIVSARLLLTVETASTPALLPIDVHRVTQDWSEGPSIASGGQGGGAPAQNGDTTWLHTDYPGALWANPGGDFHPTPSFSMELPDFGQVASISAPGLIRDMQQWLDNPNTNFGWLLKSDETGASTARKLATRESNNSSGRPRIILAYMMPGEVTEWGNGCAVGSSLFRLAPTGTPTGGATIALDYTDGPVQSLGATFFSLDLLPTGLELLPNCSAYLSPNNVIVGGATFTTDSAGGASQSITIPAGFPGVLLACQGAVLDTSPLGFALSSAALIVTQ